MKSALTEARIQTADPQVEEDPHGPKNAGSLIGRLGGRPRAAELLRGLLAVSVLGPLILFGLLAWSSYRSAFEDAHSEMVWTSDVAREHASKVFDSYKLVADRVSDMLGQHDDAAIRVDAPRLSKQFTALIAGLPQIESLIVLDRDGHLLASSDTASPDPTLDFSDRDYFKALKGGRTTFVSRVQTSRISGQTFFGWGRARLNANGDFDGVINIAISPRFFGDFYATLLSEVGATVDGRAVTMLRDDGQMLVRYPSLPGDPPVVDASNPFFVAVQAHPDGGTYTSRPLVTPGVASRLFAYRKVPGHPIYIVARRSIAAIQAEWSGEMLRVLAVGAPATAILFLITLAALRSARREASVLAQLRAEMARRHAAEDQLRQAQKMEAVGQLTGGIAHDFNNLLTVIRSSVDLLRRPNLSEERRTRYIAAISETTDRATRLTGQLLAFARRQALKPEVFDVGTDVRSIVDMVHTLAGPGIAIETWLAPGLHVKADPTQFDACLVNLVVNARDAMAREGRLTIRIEAATEVPAGRAGCPVPGDFVALAVTDTGTGIPPDRLDAIFEPFFTTKRKGEGTGLGLSQALGFAKQSGGEIAVDSIVGHGTTFTLFLPRVPAPDPAPDTRDDADDTSVLAGARVLVVEGDADVGATAIETLSSLGCTSVLARNAEDALVELAVAPGRFDLVFSDVRMPGMNGIELGQAIRVRFPNLPIVLTSGFSEILALEGTHGFELLQKPYTADRLASVLRKALRTQRAGALVS